MTTKREEVLAVLFYKREDYYVGSMSMTMVFSMFGRRYGDMSVIIEEEVKKASNETIGKIWSYLKSHILYMRKHPVVRCHHCGTVVDAHTIQKKEDKP